MSGPRREHPSRRKRNGIAQGQERDQAATAARCQGTRIQGQGKGEEARDIEGGHKVETAAGTAGKCLAVPFLRFRRAECAL